MKTTTGVWIYKAVAITVLFIIAMRHTPDAQDLLLTGTQAGNVELHPPIGSVTTLDGIRQLDEALKAVRVVRIGQGNLVHSGTLNISASLEEGVDHNMGQ